MNHNKDWTWANLVRFLVKVLNKRNILRTCAPGGLWQERNIGHSNHTKLLPGSFIWGSQETQALQAPIGRTWRLHMAAWRSDSDLNGCPRWDPLGNDPSFPLENGSIGPLGVGWNHWNDHIIRSFRRRWNKLEKIETILWYDHPNLPICLGVDHPGRACCSTCQSSASCTTGEATCKWASEGWEKR